MSPPLRYLHFRFVFRLWLLRLRYLVYQRNLHRLRETPDCERNPRGPSLFHQETEEPRHRAVPESSSLSLSVREREQEGDGEEEEEEGRGRRREEAEVEETQPEREREREPGEGASAPFVSEREERKSDSKGGSSLPEKEEECNGENGSNRPQNLSTEKDEEDGLILDMIAQMVWEKEISFRFDPLLAVL